MSSHHPTSTGSSFFSAPSSPFYSAPSPVFTRSSSNVSSSTIPSFEKTPPSTEVQTKSQTTITQTATKPPMRARSKTSSSKTSNTINNNNKKSSSPATLVTRFMASPAHLGVYAPNGSAAAVSPLVISPFCSSSSSSSSLSSPVSPIFSASLLASASPPLSPFLLGCSNIQLSQNPSPPNLHELAQFCEKNEWDKVKQFCSKNPGLILHSYFFQQLSENTRFYASQVIFNTLEDLKTAHIQYKREIEETIEAAEYKTDKLQSMLENEVKTKEDLLKQLQMIELEIKSLQVNINNMKANKVKEEEKKETALKMLELMDQAYEENKRTCLELKSEMENWKKEITNKKILDLSADEFFCLLSTMDIRHDTTQIKSEGVYWVELELEAVFQKLKIEALGDQKRLEKLFKNKSIVEEFNLPDLPLKAREQNEDKVYEWNYKDVVEWVAKDQDLKTSRDFFEKHKIDGEQLLYLNEEEMEKELRMRDKKAREKLKEKINEWKEKEHKQLPEDLKCPLTGRLMEDPVMASDGETYEKKAIEDYMKNCRFSPLTREELEEGFLRTNKVVKRKIEELKRTKGYLIQ